ncbi:unnamed protein product [Ectocarpus sp. CCAP 1310/34]|nr:unnamed protein product [Ectocarpus sp. CCAP 1310/34]
MGGHVSARYGYGLAAHGVDHGGGPYGSAAGGGYGFHQLPDGGGLYQQQEVSNVPHYPSAAGPDVQQPRAYEAFDTSQQHGQQQHYGAPQATSSSSSLSPAPGDALPPAGNSPLHLFVACGVCPRGKSEIGFEKDVGFSKSDVFTSAESHVSMPGVPRVPAVHERSDDEFGVLKFGVSTHDVPRMPAALEILMKWSAFRSVMHLSLLHQADSGASAMITNKVDAMYNVRHLGPDERFIQIGDSTLIKVAAVGSLDLRFHQIGADGKQEDLAVTGPEAVREMEPPLLRPDMPRCHAKDLRVPQTFKEAKQSEHSEQFMDAAKRERIHNCIKSKLIFDWNVNAFGFPSKAKARLVARGDMQKEYIDFGDLYAPTVASYSVRMLAALACELDLELCHFDIDQAFVRAPLKEDNFMRLPDGCGALSGKIVQLNKSLYGLRQASREWYALLKKCLLALGFEQCMADSCVFRLVEGGDVVLLLVVHVDDIFAVGTKERCDQFGKDLGEYVPVKSLGELKLYSGCYYERDREAGRLTISQQTYTEELGERYGVAWGGSIPLPTTWKLWDFDLDEPSVEYPFRALVGSLLLIALLTRPDIANSVRAVARRGDCVVLQDSKVCDFVYHAGRIRGDFMLPKELRPCIPLYEDNEGAIQIEKHPISNSNSKHIDVRHHFLRQLVDEKEVEVIHVASKYQHADFLTKALPEREFVSHRDDVMNLK